MVWYIVLGFPMKGFQMNFKSIASVIALSLVAGCASQPKPVAVEAPPPAPAVAPAPVALAPVAPANTSVVVSGDKWSYTLPDSSWEQGNVGDSSVLSIARNKKDKVVVLFMAQPFEGPADVFPLVVLSGVKEAQGTVASVEPVTINGVVYAHAVTSAKGANAHMWMTVKGGMGYDFMCGGPDSEDQTATCTAIVQTLKLQ